MNYAKAATHAAKFSDDLRGHLRSLAEADEFGVTVLGDLLAGADELLSWGDSEEALARYYRGAEQTAKVRLADPYGVRPPYRLDDILRLLPPGGSAAQDFRRHARNGQILLTAQRAWDLLAAAQDPMADSYFADTALQMGLKRRNDSMYGHGKQPVDAQQVRAVAASMRNLLREHLPAALARWTTARRPRSLV
jgi:hypothetical protein